MKCFSTINMNNGVYVIIKPKVWKVAHGHRSEGSTKGLRVYKFNTLDTMILVFFTLFANIFMYPLVVCSILLNVIISLAV